MHRPRLPQSHWLTVPDERKRALVSISSVAGLTCSWLSAAHLDYAVLHHPMPEAHPEDAIDVPDESKVVPLDDVLLDLLAVVECNLFGILDEPRVGETELSLEPLLLRGVPAERRREEPHCRTIFPFNTRVSEGSGRKEWRVSACYQLQVPRKPRSLESQPAIVVGNDE